METGYVEHKISMTSKQEHRCSDIMQLDTAGGWIWDSGSIAATEQLLHLMTKSLIWHLAECFIHLVVKGPQRYLLLGFH